MYCVVGVLYATHTDLVLVTVLCEQVNRTYVGMKTNGNILKKIICDMAYILCTVSVK